jgi:hypothetical protein
MERGIGWFVDMAGLSVVIAPVQVPAKVFNRSKDLCASEFATGLSAGCPYAKAHTLRKKIDTTIRNTLILCILLRLTFLSVPNQVGGVIISMVI